MKTALLRIFIIIVAVLLTSGCSPIVQTEQPAFENQYFVLTSSQSIGQTFLARNAGLRGVDVTIRPTTGARGTLRLSLYADSQSTAPLAVSDLPVDSIQDAGFYRFSFQLPQDTYLKSYYFELELKGSGQLELGGAPEARYIEGSVYVGRTASDGQLTFKLVYSPLGYASGLAGQLVTWGLQLALGILLFFLPGWALFSLLLPSWTQIHFEERVCLSAGLGAAWYPLLLLLTHAIGIQLGSWYAWGTLLASGLILVIRWLRFPRSSPAVSPKTKTPLAARAAFWMVALLLFGIRFWVVRTMAVPLSGDSIQHVAIVQLIQMNQGLFSSWLPYAPYSSFSVHFGYHILAAVYGWVSGLDSLQAVIISGQILNGMAVLTVYPLVTWATRGNRWAGAASMLVVGLLSPFPAYYTNYGRYSQLVGQLILPVAIWITLSILREPEIKLKKVLLAGILLSGMFLSYYRMVFLYGTFILAWMIVVGLTEWRLSFRAWGNAALKLGSMALCGTVLLVPWFPVLFGNKLGSGDVEGGIATWAQAISDYQIYSNILFYIPSFLLAFTILGLIWAFYRRSKEVLSYALWTVLMAGIVLTALIHLPGASLMQNGVVLISFYIPVGVLAGWWVGDLAAWLESGSRRAGWQIGLAAAIVLAGFWGAYQQRTLINIPRQSFATRTDLRAMAWIRDNLPADARFMVRGQRFKESSAIGGDGGWYLSDLTGRESSMPPQYALVMERPDREGYNARVINQVFQLEDVKITSPAGIDMMCKNLYSYVYLGQKTVIVDPGALKSFFDYRDLAASKDFNLVYRQDGVSIFKLNQSACRTN